MTDFVTDTYLQRCLAGERGLLDAVRDAPFPEALAEAYGKNLLARPLFVDQPTLDGFTGDLVDFFGLLTTLPQRLFGGGVERFAATLGFDAARIAVLRRFAHPPTMYGRADLYHDGETFKLLEFNVGSSLGGTDRAAQIPRALLRVDAFRAFAEEHQLTYVDTGDRIAQAFRTAADPLTGGAAPVVGFVETDGGLAEFLPRVRAFQEMMRGRGIEVVLGEVSQVVSRDGRLFLHGRPIDVVLRYFTENEIVADAAVARAADTIFRAYEAGTVVLWTTLASALFHQKGCLSLMSDPRCREAFSADETALIDRVLPWTRALTGDLVEYCRANRDDLILKPSGGFGGGGIEVGWEKSDREWVRSLTDCLGRDYLVQRRVRPRPERVVDPETGAVREWVANWGAFLTPDGYAGTYIRALPADDSAIIGAANATSTGVFSYPAKGR